MTTYNGEAFLRDQLDSILAQQRLPDELIVCDDQSADETPRLLREYAAKAPFKMTVVINEQRLGSTKNFEQAIGLCTGDIIALCDQDDVWYPHKLEVIERRFEGDTEIGLVFSNGYLIDERGRRLPGDMWRRFRFWPRLQKMLDTPPTAYDLLLSRFFITGATIALRSNLIDVCLPIPDGISTFIHDRWIAVMISGFARVEAITDKLIRYRLHPHQQMGVGKRPIIEEWLTPYRCSSDSVALSMMQKRLNALGSRTADPQFTHALFLRRRHVDTRAMLPKKLIPRLNMIVREYVGGRYQRYPLGHAYAVKDLLVGTR